MRAMFTHVLGAGAAIFALAGFVGPAHAQAPQEAGKRALERYPDLEAIPGGVVNAAAALTGSAPPAATPDAPSGIAAGDNGDGTVTVSWVDNSGDEDGFEIQREQAQKGRVKWGQTTSGTVGADVTSVVDDPGAFDTFRYRVPR